VLTKLTFLAIVSMALRPNQGKAKREML
jgi:hypothetical protein